MTREERGSIGLEAIIMLPAFLTFVFAFLICLRILMVEAALQSVANDTVKQFSGIWIPFEEQLQRADGYIGQLDHQQWEFIPDTLKPFLSALPSLSDRTKEELGHQLGVLIKPIVWQQLPKDWQGNLIKHDQLTITNVLVPYVTDSQAGFGMTLTYRMRIALPFFKKDIIIRKSAYERVWFGS